MSLDIEMALAQPRIEAPDASQQAETRCPHIGAAFAVEATRQSILKKYKAAVVWGAQSTRRGKRRKIQVPPCGTCGLSLHRPFICLHCSYGGCWQGDHVLNHLKDLDHRFCADVKTGAVFCLECDNLIWDDAFESIYQSATLAVEEKETRFTSSKKRREPYKEWKPSQKESSALQGTSPVVCQGRRGLLNLGQTCFLNVVLQALVHNPMLRNYFLSDRHNSKRCSAKDCMCCEMDKLFTEIYSGNSSPFGPTSLLATTWRASENLAGYAQQDAHEFFIFALNQIHESARGSTKSKCNCIVHSVFAGQLQSDHVCEKCGAVNARVEPILDVSLQLGAGNGKDMESTLAGCLRRFIHPETVKYDCESCKTSPQTATKRLSIRKLPPVLSFQFKRFEHAGQNGKSTPKKIDTHIRFPSFLNMAPYTTFAVSGLPEKGKKKDKDGDRFEDAGPSTLYEYDLFAVINHEGQIDNGHYTCFTRSRDEWYRFDDDKVTHTTLDAVLKSTTYMCFYVKRHLDYKPFLMPTYREHALKDFDLQKEKDRERERREERERLKAEREARKEVTVEDELLATVI